MKTGKGFDCVKMKEEAQAQLQKEWSGLTDEQVRERIKTELETSDHPVAKWWRSVASTRKHAAPKPHRH